MTYQKIEDIQILFLDGKFVLVEEIEGSLYTKQILNSREYKTIRQFETKRELEDYLFQMDLLYKDYYQKEKKKEEEK